MNGTLKRRRIFLYIFIIVQLLLLAGFCTIYFTNFLNTQKYVETRWILVGAAALVAIDAIVAWISIVTVSSYRNRSDLKAAQVIGGDIQEAYNFGMIALAVTDNEGQVIWTSELLRNRHIDILDKNIYEWQPALLPFKESNNSTNVIKIVVNNRNYDVKCLLEAGLWIFKDSTDYETIYQYSKEQAPVVGLLCIDNYDDVVRGSDDTNDAITKLKNLIFNYAKDFNILLRRHRDDTYLLLCNFDSLQRMKKDKFSLLDKVREIASDEEVPLTISLGLAQDFPDVVKLNELATEALNIAMSRGGDQVVIAVYNSEMEFYGGKTVAQENRNRVKVRVLADSLVALIRSASNVFVMGHAMADMDALGGCLGIKAMCERLEIPCQIVLDYKNTENKTRAALYSLFNKDELEEMIISPSNAESAIKPDTLLVVVDVHMESMTMAPNLVELASKVVVIDHHRRGEEYITNPVFNHIDQSASSTSEILAEFIHFSSLSPKVDMPHNYATIMLSGIFLDSTYFKSKRTGARTFEASTFLKEYGADNSIADDLLKDDYEEFKEINELISKLETPHYGVVYAYGDSQTYYDTATIAKAANTCLTLKGIHAVFVFAKTSPKEIRMSCRSDGTVNVSILAEKMGGGGAFTSAAVAFDKGDLEAVELLLKETLASHLKEASNDAKRQKDND